ncbi:MAG: hypothetical protein A3H02_00425 [Candidatus Niyogibacteria bacterium RIFCSPLOWO2_12_FULL_41_13]|uniref:Uncharacterized protein n=1 Tax=Candidatus Niyogibacteria bacterium RIFCSPLOWO2_12_FULL_41_13 TaxID=1801726 RepID=A0A1G2F1W5_9BACT|nr:MAG: hypothetical protein A3H02_00425 [Candidatus Niyogibacteria bacterium RIFCSPLOWO2_12_FULL_41_13]
MPAYPAETVNRDFGNFIVHLIILAKRAKNKNNLTLLYNRCIIFKMKTKNAGKFYIIFLGFILSGFFLFAPLFKANAEQPAVSFSADPSVIQKGESVALSWSATSSMYCIASGGWSGSKLLFGSANVFPEKTTNYNINCVGPDGITSAFKSVGVTVLGGPSPVPISGPISIEQFRVGCAANPSPARINEEVVFVASQAGGNIPVSYKWSGGVAGTDSPIKISFSTLGVKIANLSAIDSFGRRAEATCSIQVLSAAPSPLPEKQAAITIKKKEPAKTDSQVAAIGAQEKGKSLLLWFFLILSGLTNLALIIYIALTKRGEDKIEAKSRF